MKFCVVSAFRNSPRSQVARWARQCAALHTTLRDHHYLHFSVIAVEGDSSDNGATRRYITHEFANSKFNSTLLATCNHGRPFYGSIEHPDRMSSLSLVANCMLDSIPPDTDYLLYVESDLIWDSLTVLTLLQLLEQHPEYAVVAPLVFAGQLFYDVYCFRGLDGARFSPFPPFHASCNARSFMAPPLVEVGSAGSCLLMRGPTARSIRITDGAALVGWCAAARQAGHRIAVAVEQSIRHPA